MLNKSLLYLALALLTVISLTSEAIACRPSDAVCLNQSCNEFDLGTTAIDYDKKNILACLKNDAGQKTWKSMTVQLKYIKLEGYCTDFYGLSIPAAQQRCLFATPPAYCSGNRCACPADYSVYMKTGGPSSTEYGFIDPNVYYCFKP